MTKGLLPTHSVFLFLPEASPYEVFGSFGDVGVEDDWLEVDGA